MRSRLLPALAVATLGAASIASAAIPATERQVLLDLYSSTNGPGWTHRTGWGGPAGTECSWYGVQCDAAGGHVTTLNLDSNNLAGPLPALAPLSALRYGILSNNRLTGTIPTVSSLTQLRILELYANSLTGSIPSLDGLSSLTSLELNSNQLTGSIPSLASLTSLQVLDLDTNALTGPVPSLSAMTQLQYIALDTNRLSGPIPSFSGLTQLSDCELYANDFGGSVPSLANLPNLRILLLSNNALTGPFPDVTGTALETLDLDYNSLSGPIPSTVGNAKTLRNLLCAGNVLVGSLPSSLPGLTSLADGGSDFRYNGLYSTSASLTSFLDGKQEGGDWQSTQTIPPAGVSAGSPTNNAVRLSWTPIAYTADAGAYDVWISTASGGPFALFGSTEDKSTSEMTVTGLDPSSAYYFAVRTTTDPGANNANRVTSGDSTHVSAGTTSCGACALTPASFLVEGVSPYPPSTSEPNGVLEPNETASVTPMWTNTTAGAIDGVSGSLAGFSGPNDGGETYAITDASASYGNIPAAETQSCGSSAYQVRISASSRPAAHWDALVQETLNTGEVHTWTLHVGDSFSDVPPSRGFYPYIETIFHHGITTGFSAGVYGPSASTRRDQMSAFIARAHAGSDPAIPTSGSVPGLGKYDCESGGQSLFTDVSPASGFCRSIHYIAAHGMTYGCSDAAQFSSSFCPAVDITRATMAVFLARDLAGGDSNVPSSASSAATGRSYDCTDGKPNAFPDVSDANPDCRYVYFIWSKGIVDGFSNGDYGPAGAVSRDQMAKYLTNSYRLTLSDAR